MEKYTTIFHRAAERHGGEDAFKKKLKTHQYHHDPDPKSDDRWLSEFTRRVFQSGFNWQVVDNKWDGFEAAFWNFDVEKCAEIDMEDMERLTSDKGIVRNPVKIKTVAQNARMIMNMSQEAGSADVFIRGWAQTDYIDLLDYLQKNGSHLGMNTASYALRFSSVPSFILSNDVTAALKHAGVIDKPVTSKAAKKAVQEAFNQWADESGEDLTVISRTLAMSIDAG